MLTNKLKNKILKMNANNPAKLITKINSKILMINIGKKVLKKERENLLHKSKY